jgi:hypothetical protein
MCCCQPQVINVSRLTSARQHSDHDNYPHNAINKIRCSIYTCTHTHHIQTGVHNTYITDLDNVIQHTLLWHTDSGYKLLGYVIIIYDIRKLIQVKQTTVWYSMYILDKYVTLLSVQHNCWTRALGQLHNISGGVLVNSEWQWQYAKINYKNIKVSALWWNRLHWWLQ